MNIHKIGTVAILRLKMPDGNVLILQGKTFQN
jgi:hypothetical protein